MTEVKNPTTIDAAEAKKQAKEWAAAFEHKMAEYNAAQRKAATTAAEDQAKAHTTATAKKATEMTADQKAAMQKAIDHAGELQKAALKKIIAAAQGTEEKSTEPTAEQKAAIHKAIEEAGEQQKAALKKIIAAAQAKETVSTEHATTEHATTEHGAAEHAAKAKAAEKAIMHKAAEKASDGMRLAKAVAEHPEIAQKIKNKRDAARREGARSAKQISAELAERNAKSDTAPKTPGKAGRNDQLRRAFGAGAAAGVAYVLGSQKKAHSAVVSEDAPAYGHNTD